MTIKLKRVIGSGLVAGLAINILGMALIPVLGNRMDEVLESRALAPLSGGAMAYFGIMSLILGVIIVWMYAIAIPRLGSGMKTAAIISVVVWFLTYFWSNASMVAFGFMPIGMTAIGTVWGLVELIAAGVIGALLYKDG